MLEAHSHTTTTTTTTTINNNNNNKGPLYDLAYSLKTCLWRDTEDLLTLHTGTDFSFVDLNPAAVENLGYSHDEIIGKPLQYFLHPEDVEDVLQKIYSGKTAQLSFRLKTKSNEFIPLEGIVSEVLDVLCSVIILSRKVNHNGSENTPRVALKQIMEKSPQITNYIRCSIRAPRSECNRRSTIGSDDNKARNTLNNNNLRCSLPLSPHHFSSLDLSVQQRNDLLQHAVDAIPALVFQGIWHTQKYRKGIRIVQDLNKENSWHSFRALATVKGTMEEVMELLSTTTTTSFRSFMQEFHHRSFIDGAVLQTYTMENGLKQSEEATLGMKWAAFQSCSPLIDNRDFCYFDYTTITAKEIDGIPKVQDVDMLCGIQLMESIELPEISEMKTSHRLDRCEIKNSGFLVYPAAQRGYHQVCFTINMREDRRSSRVSSRAIRTMTHKMVLSLTRLQAILDSRRINQTDFIKIERWVQDDCRAGCFVCMKSFTHWRRRHHCRICGEVICSKCSVFKHVNLPAVGLSRIRICKACETLSSSEQEAQSSKHHLSSKNEPIGCKELRSSIHDEAKEGIFGMLCDLATQVMNCKIAVFGYLDENNEWRQASIGLGKYTMSHDEAFCRNMLVNGKPLIVHDATQDARFRNHCLVSGEAAIRFFAGAPLIGNDGDCLGFICACDVHPHEEINLDQMAVMQNLARLACNALEKAPSAFHPVTEKKREQAPVPLVDLLPQ